MMVMGMEHYFSCRVDGVEAKRMDVGDDVGLRCPHCGQGDTVSKETLEEVLAQVSGAPHLYTLADWHMTEALGRQLAFTLRIPDPTLPRFEAQ